MGRQATLIMSMLLLCACQSLPRTTASLEQIRAQIQTLSQDPLALQAAGNDLAAARKSLEQAETALQQKRPPADVNHLAYLARRHVEAGEARVSEAHARQQIAQAQDQRDKILMGARAREALNAQAQADAAKAQADAANNQALSAQQQLAAAQQQLADLRAKQTDRGVVVTLGDVLFDTHQAELKPGVNLALNRLSTYLSSNPDTKIIIEGHTDSVGSDEYNDALSERRAKAVSAELESRGVAASQIQTRGRGREYPVASNGTPEGRQQNRRVEIVFSDRSGAASSATTASAADQAATNATASDPYARELVYYATDRRAIGGRDVSKAYGGERGTLVYGVCRVSIPRDHRMGEIESPSMWLLQFTPDPARDVTLLDVRPTDPATYFADLKRQIARSASHSALVFVHGYNVTFADAARRTAQMAYDLGFDGAPIFFSWPSQGQLADYPIDETNVEWAKPHLQTFLKEILANTQAENVFLIAHSMGNRALVSAFQELVRADPSARSRIREVILAAPDIDADIFKTQIVPALVGTGALTTHVTLYASSRDMALAASKRFHGYPRAGDSSPTVVTASGLESIDASALDTSFLGHSYFADTRSVLSDMFQLLRNHVRACNRFGQVERRSSEGSTYCVMQP